MKKKTKKISRALRLYRKNKELRSTIAMLHNCVKTQEKTLDRLRATIPILRFTCSKPRLVSAVDFGFELNRQTAWLKGVINRIKHGQMSENNFAICDYQPGVPLHPILWLPNNMMLSLSEALLDNKTDYSFAIERPYNPQSS